MSADRLYKGTVRYYGPIHGADGTTPLPGVYVGVEWDDITRGNHGGSLHGRHYFTCERHRGEVEEIVDHPDRRRQYEKGTSHLPDADADADADAHRDCGGEHLLNSDESMTIQSTRKPNPNPEPESILISISESESESEPVARMLPSDAMMKKNGKRTGASNPNPNPNPNGKRTGASFVRAKLLVPSVSFGEEFLAMYDEEPSAEDAVIRIVAPRSMRSMRQVRNTKT